MKTWNRKEEEVIKVYPCPLSFSLSLYFFRSQFQKSLYWKYREDERWRERKIERKKRRKRVRWKSGHLSLYYYFVILKTFGETKRQRPTLCSRFSSSSSLLSSSLSLSLFKHDCNFAKFYGREDKIAVKEKEGRRNREEREREKKRGANKEKTERRTKVLKSKKKTRMKMGRERDEDEEEDERDEDEEDESKRRKRGWRFPSFKSESEKMSLSKKKDTNYWRRAVEVFLSSSSFFFFLHFFHFASFLTISWNWVQQKHSVNRWKKEKKERKKEERERRSVFLFPRFSCFSHFWRPKINQNLWGRKRSKK